ncbi:MAG: tetratricopeptide repeat protein, partial [Muribaculaceae bacterium]|nr:tetratricopeptide repeat protein [Muribaculaceae bacterium]
SITIRLILSALTLGAVEFFDKEKLDILIETYGKYAEIDSPEADEICACALVGIVFVLLKYRDRQLPASTVKRLAAIKETKTWKTDLENAVLEIIRARDTERINRTMRDEIIPGMMAMRPEIEKKLKDGDLPLEEFDGMQMNPEWEEILRKSGISDKLKELNELQMEGSDVFMSTFAHLKNFVFFNNVSGWFTPFSASAKSVEKVISKQPELADIAVLIETLPFLCDSDKYSMMFSVEMVPEAQRKMMLGQIQSQRAQMADMASNFANETLPVRRKKALRNYLHNVYRFYNLFRRKSEFYNAFEFASDLLLISPLKEELSRPEILGLISEFYFKRNYWTDALVAFRKLDEQNEFSSAIYQKMGYCYEKTGNIDKAIEAYEQADLLDNSSIWLKKRLAKVYRAAGRLDEAIQTYKDIVKLEPENTSTALSLGYTLIQAERFEDAIKEFYKVEFLDEKSRKSLRPLAWCLFMTGEFAKAQGYYEKILLDNPGSEDYINMGHVALALGQIKDAINFYKLSIIKGDGSVDTFFKTLELDRPSLAKVGIETSTVSLIADAMLYTLHP